MQLVAIVERLEVILKSDVVSSIEVILLHAHVVALLLLEGVVADLLLAAAVEVLPAEEVTNIFVSH